MNIFILNAGRCGSTTFINACSHITNFTAAHESRCTLTGEQRLAYPGNHIEADNRLCWLLGRLDRKYGNQALYVHLTRNKVDTADSFARRYKFGIMKAYRQGILQDGQDNQSAHDLACDYLDTVESNITLFLGSKTGVIDFRLENAKQDFDIFWNTIGAEGDLEKALAEWDIAYNSSD